MNKEFLLAVIIIIVIYLLYTRMKSQTCHDQMYTLNGVSGTAAEICTRPGGMWDDVAKTCRSGNMYDECDNFPGLMKDLCVGAGGQYVPGCNICTGDVSEDLNLDLMAAAFTRNCANLIETQ